MEAETTESNPTEIGRLGERIVNLLAVLDSKYTFVGDEYDEILEAVKKLEEKAWDLQKGKLFPFDSQVEEILGRPNFWCGPIAHVLRAQGQNIPTKAEAEQAAVLYWMLGLYFEHGENWKREGAKLLKPTPAAEDQKNG